MPCYSNLWMTYKRTGRVGAQGTAVYPLMPLAWIPRDNALPAPMLCSDTENAGAPKYRWRFLERRIGKHSAGWQLEAQESQREGAPAPGQVTGDWLGPRSRLWALGAPSKARAKWGPGQLPRVGSYRLRGQENKGLLLCHCWVVARLASAPFLGMPALWASSRKVLGGIYGKPVSPRPPWTPAPLSDPAHPSPLRQRNGGSGDSTPGPSFHGVLPRGPKVPKSPLKGWSCSGLKRPLSAKWVLPDCGHLLSGDIKRAPLSALACFQHPTSPGLLAGSSPRKGKDLWWGAVHLLLKWMEALRQSSAFHLAYNL